MKNKEIDGLHEQVEKLEAEKTGWEEKFSKTESARKYDEVCADLESKNTKLKELEKQVSKLEAEEEILKKQVETLETEVKELKKRVTKGKAKERRRHIRPKDRKPGTQDKSTPLHDKRKRNTPAGHARLQKDRTDLGEKQHYAQTERTRLEERYHFTQTERTRLEERYPRLEGR